MRSTLGEIARFVNGELFGEADIIISGAAGIKEAKEGDITFLGNSRYTPMLERTLASAIITSRDFKPPSNGKPILRTDNPSIAFAKIISLINPSRSYHPRGIHASAILGKGVSLGEGVGIGAYAVIEDGVSVGDGTVIYPGCFIGGESSVGNDCIIYPGVLIREKTIILNRVIIHSGTVIGSDGFGFANTDGTHEKIPQVGVVEIQDDVEIGANVTIDRARFDKTIIGSGTKIDNLVQIAHNVTVGKNSIIVAQAGISGSTIIGNNVTLAGQAGLVGHISVGDRAVVGAQAGVTKSVAAGTVVSGYPARPHNEAKKINACVQRLPELYKVIQDLRNKVAELEKRVENKSN